MGKARLGPELSRAARKMQTGRLKEAEMICREVLRRDKSDVDGWQMLGLLESMRGLGVKPGEYMFPHLDSPKDLGTPEGQAKFDQGPVGTMTILPNGVPSMGKNLTTWFLYTLLVSFFVGYVASVTLAAGADYMRVFRVTGSMAVFVYATYSIPASVWRGQSWGVTAKFVFDGIVYGLLTAGVFGWLWPAAAA